MALSSAQKLQALRLPVIDASVSSGDKHALLGLIVTATSAPTLTEAQRKQLLRLPIVDASVSTSDKFAFLGLMESEDSGAIVELFQTTWLLDPTWHAFQNPQSNDGQIFAEIGEFISSLPGINVDPVIIESAPPNEGTSITNSQATDGVGYYEIDDRTGFKMLPVWHPDSKLVQDGYGHYVRSKSADDRHPQDNLASGRNLPHEGPQSPEDSDNNFIAVSVAAEDL